MNTSDVERTSLESVFTYAERRKHYGVLNHTTRGHSTVAIFKIV